MSGLPIFCLVLCLGILPLSRPQVTLDDARRSRNTRTEKKKQHAFAVFTFEGPGLPCLAQGGSGNPECKRDANTKRKNMHKEAQELHNAKQNTKLRHMDTASKKETACTAFVFCAF